MFDMLQKYAMICKYLCATTISLYCFHPFASILSLVPFPSYLPRLCTISPQMFESGSPGLLTVGSSQPPPSSRDTHEESQDFPVLTLQKVSVAENQDNSAVTPNRSSKKTRNHRQAPNDNVSTLSVRPLDVDSSSQQIARECPKNQDANDSTTSTRTSLVSAYGSLPTLVSLNTSATRHGDFPCAPASKLHSPVRGVPLFPPPSGNFSLKTNDSFHPNEQQVWMTQRIHALSDRLSLCCNQFSRLAQSVDSLPSTLDSRLSKVTEYMHGSIQDGALNGLVEDGMYFASDRPSIYVLVKGQVHTLQDKLQEHHSSRKQDMDIMHMDLKSYVLHQNQVATSTQELLGVHQSLFSVLTMVRCLWKLVMYSHKHRTWKVSFKNNENSFNALNNCPSVCKLGSRRPCIERHNRSWTMCSSWNRIG